MARFRYRVITADKQGMSGEVEADSRSHALGLLSVANGTVVELEEAVRSQRQSPESVGKLNEREKITALFELASMLNAGVPAAESVESQTKSAAHPAARHAFRSMLKALRHGEGFSVALEQAELKLPEYVYQLVRAGEMTGDVGVALEDACAQMEYALEVKNEARNALIYPVILVLSGVLAVVMMFVFVVPSFTGLLEQADKLPWLAWAVLTAGDWANSNPLIMPALVASMVGIIYIAAKVPVVRRRALALAERLPMVGPWLIQSDIAAWSRMMASMLKNRVELINALNLAVAVVRSPGRRVAMENARKAVKNGVALSAALEANGCLNETGYNLIRVGEKSGRLDAMLFSLATLYARQGQQRMKKVLALIEPAAILIIGGAIGTLIIAIILAITSANDIAI